MRTKMTNELVCPHCGAIQDMSDVKIFSEDNCRDRNISCENCEREFKYEVHVFYSSWKKGDSNGI